MPELVETDFFSTDQVAEYNRLAEQDHPSLVVIANARLVQYQNTYDEEVIRSANTIEAHRSLGVIHTLGAIALGVLIKEPAVAIVGVGMSMTMFTLCYLPIRKEHGVAKAKSDITLNYLTRAAKNLPHRELSEVLQ